MTALEVAAVPFTLLLLVGHYITIVSADGHGGVCTRPSARLAGAGSPPGLKAAAGSGKPPRLIAHPTDRLPGNARCMANHAL